MAKTQIKPKPIKDLLPLLKNEPLPIYYFFGEDNFAIEKAVELIKKTYSDLLTSDFDNETLHATKATNLTEILMNASSFPFGSEKKLVVVKKFNLVKEKKKLTEYIEAPTFSTILILLDESTRLNANSEPYKTLASKGYLFEAKKISGSQLIGWIKARAKELKIFIDNENAQRLLEIVGEEKQLLMRQIEKLRDYLGEGKTVSAENIINLTSPTKKYTTFDLQDAFLKGNKQLSIKIAFHLLDNGIQLYEILPILTSAVYILTQSLEFKRNPLPNKQAEAKKVGAHPFYYQKITSSPYFTTEDKIKQAAKALLNADLTIKTTAANQKNVFLQLVSEIFNRN